MNIPVTEWFPAEVKPFYVGFYEVERQFVGNIYPKKTILEFTGDSWVHTEHSSNGQYVGIYASMNGRDKWRGLTSPHPEWKP